MAKIPQMLLYIYIISVVLISSVPEGNDLSKWFGYFLIFIWVVIDYIILRKKIKIPVEGISFVLFFIAAMLGIFSAKDPNLVLLRLWTLAQVFGLYIIMFNIILSSKNSYKCYKNCIVSLIIGGLISLIYSFSTIDFYSLSDVRIGGTFMQTNAYATALVFIIMFSILLHDDVNSRWLKWLFSFYISASMILLILTGSRQGLVGTGVALFSLVIFSKFKGSTIRPMKYIRSAIVLIVLGILIFNISIKDLYLSERVYDAWLFVTEGSSADIRGESLHSRASFLEAGIRMWLDNPLLGVGLNNYTVNALEYGALKEAYAHNNYLEILATTGIAGFLAYFSVYFLILRRYYLLAKNKKNYLNSSALIVILISSAMSFFAISLFRTFYYAKFEWIILSLLIIGFEVIRQDGSANKVSNITHNDGVYASKN